MVCLAAAWALLLLACVPAGHAALTVGVGAPERMVTDLRHTIFVDVAYLARHQEEQLCTSLDGPKCMGYMNDRSFAAGLGGHRTGMDGPGVIPDIMLHDIGIKDGDVVLTAPLYTELEGLRRQLNAEVKAEHMIMLGSIEDSANSVQVRSKVKHGVMHFADLMPDQRMPLTFSRGLPEGVVATWDGQWIVRNCSQSDAKIRTKPLPASAVWPLALPAPDPELRLGSGTPMLAPSAKRRARASYGELVEPGASAVAELSGSLAYLRFSQPVVVRALLARWAPRAGAPPAMVAGRLGLQGVWSAHVDPGRLQHQDWMDVGGSSLQPIDEIAFMATPGLEIGAMWIASHGNDSWGESNERAVMLLEPASNASMTEASSHPKWFVKTQKITPAALPFVMSLQEAVDQGLQLRAQPTSWAVPHSHGMMANYPGMVTTASMQPGMWTAVAALNQEMLEHRLLAQMLRHLPTDPEHVAAVLGHLSLALPRDLQRELDRERQAAVDALHGWASSHGKWHHATPSTLPVNGTDMVVQRYMQAKRWQTKFDLLTVGFLHQIMRPQLQLRPAWHAQQQRQHLVDLGRAQGTVLDTL